MISVENEFLSVEVHVEFGYAEDYGESFLFYLTVILFFWAE